LAANAAMNGNIIDTIVLILFWFSSILS
jgi:hypothetical protein